MKRCPTCNKDFPDEANFCPVDAAQLVAIETAAPVEVPRVDTGGHELLDGRFALGDIIGGHRSGPVYRAGDKQGTSAMVKFVNANVFPSALLKQRTERELKQLEKLNHPGVARVLGHGRRDDTLWIATEIVEGVPLGAFVAQSGPLPEPRATAMLLQIGAALEAAAKHGVTHRDLSPKNILVSGGDQIKVINFGVPVPGPEGRNDVQGECEFVAPEQIEGRPVDQRGNIYSLGAIATLLLTGSPPFTGAPLDVLAAHVNSPVSALGPAQGVSDKLGQTLLKSLEKTSSKRFMTLRQFLGDVEKAAASSAGGKPSSASKDDMKKTLMGVTAADVQNAMSGSSRPEAVGTPPPGGPEDGPAVTAVDHTPPAMAESEERAATAPAPHVPTPAPHVPTPAPHVPTPVPHVPTPAPAQVAHVPTPAAQPMAPQMARVPSSPANPSPGGSPGGKRSGTQTPEAAAAAAEKKKKKGKFRETMWFKKGELDEAAARAAAQAQPESGVSSKADEMEMDVRYSDDGSITEQDKDRLSLRTGATMMMEAIPEQSAKHHVSEDELVSEMTAGRNKILIGLGVGVVALGILLAVVFS